MPKIRSILSKLLFISVVCLLSACAQTDTTDLIAQLSDERSHIRRKAAYTLIDLGENSVKPIIQVIADAPDTVRYIGAQILGRIGSPSASDILLSLAHDPNPYVKNQALRAIGKIHRPELVDTLTHFSLHSKTADSRAAAIEGLSSLRDSSTSSTILALMSDPSPLVRKAALAAIGKQLTHLATQHVIHLVTDTDETVRYIAVQLCGVRGIKEAAQTLHTALNDPSIHVRTEATKSVKLLQDTTAIPHLITLIKRFDGPDSESALKTLRDLTGNEYIVQ